MTKLWLVYDPMCSWCWCFTKIWQKIIPLLSANNITSHYLLGGLAADSDLPMPITMQNGIESIWHRIAQEYDIEFNFNFWTQNQPRRSTYPACRAVLAATKQMGLSAHEDMTLAIQQAYYLQAKNPSNTDVLLDCAQSIGLDRTQFSEDLHAKATQIELQQHIDKARSIGGNSFPSLIVERDAGRVVVLPNEYRNAQSLFEQIMLEMNRTNR